MNYGLLVTLVIIYCAIIGYLGYLGYRHTKDSKDYMLAGGEVHPYLMAMAYGSTFISTSAIVGFGGAAGMYGLSMLWLTVFNIFAGVFVAFVFFGKRIRAMSAQLGARTFPELMGKRYNSDFIRKFSAALIAVSMPLYAAAVMIGGARYMQEALQMNFTSALWILAIIVTAYVLFGGLKGIIYTDAFQGTLMFLTMAVIIVLTYIKVGGISASHSFLAGLASKVPASLAAKGHTGWASMPAFGSEIWWMVVSTLVLGVGIGVLAQPQLAVRFMTVKTSRELNRGVLIGGVFILFMTGVAFIVGSLSNVYFMEHGGKLALQMVTDPLTKKPNVDLIIPMFISKAFPVGITYIFLLTLLSAAMSTLSGQFHVIATSINYDLFNGEKMDDKTRLRLARIGIIIALVFTMIISLWLPGSIIAIATSIFFGLCAAAFLPMLIGALFWKRATTAGVTIGMIAGSVVYLFSLFFMHAKEASIFGVCKALTGKDVLFSFPWTAIDPLVLGLPVGLLVMYVASTLTKPIDQAHLTHCFEEESAPIA